MNDSPRWGLLALAGAVLVAGGIGVGALLWRTPSADLPAEAGSHPAAASAPAPDAGEAVDHAAMGHGPAPAGEEAATVTLTPDMVTRAGIRTVPAAAGSTVAQLRIPGVVEPNRYKQVAVTSLVSGRITQARAELGDRVRAGQVLATLYSTEFADAQTEYVRLHSELEAHELALTRTQRLASIGAASRQELDRMVAEHAAADAGTDAARSRLTLLGLPPERIKVLETEHEVTTTIDIPSPIAGIVSERTASVGANIDPATPLFTVVDLSTVWVIGDLYERDFAAVQVGSPATVTTTAYPGLALQGKVSYIDPTVQSETRTAKVRVEVPNAGLQLRLGMYVDIGIERGATEAAVLVPAGAVQTVGDARVVYVAGAGPGEFVERRVEVGETSGDRVRIVSGVSAGELVVADGAFYLRAERERASGGAAPAHQH